MNFLAGNFNTGNNNDNFANWKNSGMNGLVGAQGICGAPFSSLVDSIKTNTSSFPQISNIFMGGGGMENAMGFFPLLTNLASTFSRPPVNSASNFVYTQPQVTQPQPQVEQPEAILPQVHIEQPQTPAENTLSNNITGEMRQADLAEIKSGISKDGFIVSESGKVLTGLNALDSTSALNNMDSLMEFYLKTPDMTGNDPASKNFMAGKTYIKDKMTEVMKEYNAGKIENPVSGLAEKICKDLNDPNMTDEKKNQLSPIMETSYQYVDSIKREAGHPISIAALPAHPVGDLFLSETDQNNAAKIQKEMEQHNQQVQQEIAKIKASSPDEKKATIVKLSQELIDLNTKLNDPKMEVMAKSQIQVEILEKQKMLEAAQPFKYIYRPF